MVHAPMELPNCSNCAVESGMISKGSGVPKKTDVLIESDVPGREILSGHQAVE